MIYPIILMLMSFAIVMGLMTYVVPDIVKTFDQSKDALPWITVALMKASDFIRVAWPFLLVAGVVGFIVLVRFLRTSAGHYAFDRLTLKLPLFGKLSRGINAVVDALKIGAAVSNNWVIRDSVNLAAEKVTEGGNLATQLERSGYFPPMMVQMIKSGEASGELDRMLERASTMQDREVTTLISTLLALLEPLMLVVMASIVLVIVIAVMLPIVNMNNMI